MEQRNHIFYTQNEFNLVRSIFRTRPASPMTRSHDQAVPIVLPIYVESTPGTTINKSVEIRPTLFVTAKYKVHDIDLLRVSLSSNPTDVDNTDVDMLPGYRISVRQSGPGPLTARRPRNLPNADMRTKLSALTLCV